MSLLRLHTGELIVALVSIACGAGSAVAPAGQACSSASLTGTYGSQRNGQTAPGANFTAVGLITFDGHGNSVAKQSTSLNGAFSSVASQSGNYLVSADCSGTEPDQAGTVISKFVVVHGGDEVLGLSTVLGSTLTYHYERISTNCANAALNGTYGFQRNGQAGVGIPLVAIGIITFDGHGNSTAHQTTDRNGTLNVVDQVGTYSINPDCTGTQTDTTGKVFSQLVVVNGGDEVLGMSLTVPNNVVIHYERIKQ